MILSDYECTNTKWTALNRSLHADKTASFRTKCYNQVSDWETTVKNYTFGIYYFPLKVIHT